VSGVARACIIGCEPTFAPGHSTSTRAVSYAAGEPAACDRIPRSTVTGRRRPPEGKQRLRVGAASGWASAAGLFVCVREGAGRARGRLGVLLQPKRSEAHAHTRAHTRTNASAHTSRVSAGFMRDTDNKEHMGAEAIRAGEAVGVWAFGAAVPVVVLFVRALLECRDRTRYELDRACGSRTSAWVV
jgi:hypothetical protein